jgi:tellurite resistance protein TehA-like permease
MIYFKRCLLDFFSKTLFISFLIAIGLLSYVYKEQIPSEFIGKPILLIISVPFLFLYLIFVAVKFIDSPKEIRLDLNSNDLFIDSDSFILSEVEKFSLTMIKETFAKEALAIEVIIPKGNVIFTTKVNYVCNLPIHEVEDKITEFNNISIHIR